MVAHPDSGERWDAVRRTGVGEGSALPVAAWVGAGARLVGGCCRVGPSGTAAVARQLAAHAGAPGGAQAVGTPGASTAKTTTLSS